MSSESLQITALEPFIQKFTIAMIKVFKERNINPRERFILHDDLIPRLSPEVQEYSMRQRHIRPDGEKFVPLVEKALPQISLEPQELPFSEPELNNEPKNLKIDNEFRQKVQHHTQVISESLKAPIPQLQKRSVVQNVAPVQAPQMIAQPEAVEVPTVSQMPEVAPEQVSNVQEDVSSQEPYGKITILLHDPSVSVIDCNGPGKPIIVTRYGRKQITKITLSADEIANILDTISQEAHIPLMEGIFRAVVKDFSVTAIISEMVGSKFSIKKQIQIPGAGVRGY